MNIKLIKDQKPFIECAKDIKNILEKAGYFITDEKTSQGSYQYKILKNNKIVGFLRFYQRKDNSTTIDDSQMTSSNKKDDIRNLLGGYLNLKAFEKGKIPLNSRQIPKELISDIKNKLLENFPDLRDQKLSDQIHEYRLAGINLAVTQFNIGTLNFQGISTKFSDSVIEFVDKLISEYQKRFLLSNLEDQVSKEDYEFIKKSLEEKDVSGDLIPRKVYSVLSGCGSYLLHDGLVIFNTLKTNKIHLKDYGSLLRNFGIVLEDFLVNWMIRLKIISEDDLKVNVREMYIGKILQDSIKIEKYKQCYSRSKPRFIQKLQSTYQECRNEILHADKYTYKPIESIEKAESKVNLIMDVMEDCVNLFSDYLENNGNHSNGVLGTDESGKGDYFGPLVVSGVFIDSEETEMKLRNLGIKDSKKIEDKKIRLLADEIRKICKWSTVKISPERYNQLYFEIKNLNKLLGWGHARVIEDVLKSVDPSFVISDKFGDESFINSKLMERGKKVNLIQQVGAEQNIAVAAASILARDTFLEYLERMSREYNLNFPKGVNENVINTGRNIVDMHGKEAIKKVAKIHFITTNKILEKK